MNEEMKDYLKFWSLCFIIAILVFILDTVFLPVKSEEKVVDPVKESTKIEEMNCPDISIVHGVGGVKDGHRDYKVAIDECSGKRGEKVYGK